MDEDEELLFRQCKEFVDEQSSGEWDDVIVEADARAMMAFINKVRPPRVKLNMKATAEVVAMLDGSAKREDEAREVARLAAGLIGSGKFDPPASRSALVHNAVLSAREILAEARRAVASPEPAS